MCVCVCVCVFEWLTTTITNTVEEGLVLAILHSIRHLVLDLGQHGRTSQYRGQQSFLPLVLILPSMRIPICKNKNKCSCLLYYVVVKNIYIMMIDKYK